MTKKSLNLDEIMDEVNTVAELSLVLTGYEVLGLAKAGAVRAGAS